MEWTGSCRAPGGKRCAPIRTARQCAAIVFFVTWDRVTVTACEKTYDLGRMAQRRLKMPAGRVVMRTVLKPLPLTVALAFMATAGAAQGPGWHTRPESIAQAAKQQPGFN